MNRRIDGPDLAAILGVALGALALFIPWYSYSTATTHITVNGFRASILGEVFFVAVAAMALLQLIRHGAVDEQPASADRERQVFVLIAGVAGSCVVLQLMLDIAAGGRSLGFGFLLAVLGAAALGVAAWLRAQARVFSPVRQQHLGEDLPD